MYRHLAAAAVATIAVLAPSATPAAAAAAQSELVVSYLADAGYAAAVTLECSPPGGAHPAPIRACNKLKSVAGKPAGLTMSPDAMCTLEYAPITARITGTWKGSPVEWSQRFGNACEMFATAGWIVKF